MKIELKNIEKTINKRVILDKLTYTFLPDEFYIIKGDNGAGKTTLLYILALLDKNYFGEYLLDGKDAKYMDNKETKKIKANSISLIFSKGNLLSFLNVLESDSLFNKNTNYTNEIRKDFDLNLDLNQNVTTLSGGEEILLSLINELSLNKEVILLDEVTSSLDDEHFYTLMNLLLKYKKDKIIILVSHDPRSFKYGKQLTLSNGKLYLDESNIDIK